MRLQQEQRQREISLMAYQGASSSFISPPPLNPSECIFAFGLMTVFFFHYNAGVTRKPFFTQNSLKYTHFLAYFLVFHNSYSYTMDMQKGLETAQLYWKDAFVF